MSVQSATVEQTTNLAIWLQAQGISPEQSIQWLKSRMYTIRGVHFEAVRVANIIVGINIGIAMATPAKVRKTRVSKTKL